jgi:hypothetical protein
MRTSPVATSLIAAPLGSYSGSPSLAKISFTRNRGPAYGRGAEPPAWRRASGEGVRYEEAGAADARSSAR